MALVVTLLIAGCSKPEEVISRRLLQANQNLDAGRVNEAVSILERLNETYVDQPSVLEALGFAYSRAGNHAAAGASFERVADMDENAGSLRQLAASSFFSAGNLERAAQQYRLYLGEFPGDYTAWESLGRIEEQNGNLQRANDAYLECYSLRQSGDIAWRIGSIFRRLNNAPQTKAWLETTIKHADTHVDESLLGLLELEVNSRDFAAAERTLNQLDQYYPGTLEASPLREARDIIAAWREQQDAFAAARSAQQRTAREIEDERRRRREEERAAVDAPRTTAATATPPPPQAQPSSSSSSPAGTTPPAPEPAPAPARERELASAAPRPAESAASANEAGSATAAENVAATRAPAATVASADENVGPAGNAPAPEAEPVDITVDDANPAAVAAAAEAAAASETPLPQDIQTAVNLRNSGRTDAAIAVLWALVAQDDSRVDAWLELGRSYRSQRKFGDAESCLLEAERRDPDNVAVTLEYLAVVRESQPRDRYFARVEAARRKFPGNANLAFTLAHELAAMEGNRLRAVSAYEDFLLLAAPDDPRRNEASAFLARVRGQ